MVTKGGRPGKTPSPRPTARSSGTAPPRPIEIVYFPKRARRPVEGDAHTEEIHTERVDNERFQTVVEERTTDIGEMPPDRNTTERELRAVDLQLMTPDSVPASTGHLEDPRATLAYHRARLREMVATTPPDRPLSDTADLSLFAHSLLEQGRLGEARVVFEGIVAREPNMAFPYAMLGSVYLAQADDERALALFEAALRIDPEDPCARLHRAELRLKSGENSLAMKDLDKVLAADPEQVEEITGRAETLRQQLPKKASKKR
jgi:hypothetical protein